MRTWKCLLLQGKYFLAKHKPEKALKPLKNALAGCPVNKTRSMVKILFYLGIVLKKLGYCESAMQTWTTARRMIKTGHIKKMINRYSNDYGMLKQKRAIDDDQNAFYCIQLNKYMDTKSTKKIGTVAERDMLNHLIHDAWKNIVKTIDLSVISIAGKYQLFSETTIIFPLFRVPENKFLQEVNIINIDFYNKKKMTKFDQCSCGSGILYGMCCGREQNIEKYVKMVENDT